MTGLYGTTSYAVARRTGEIGIRMALGAQGGTVVWMVLRDGLILAILGVDISLLPPAAMGASKLIESILFGVKPGDPQTLAAAAAAAAVCIQPVHIPAVAIKQFRLVLFRFAYLQHIQAKVSPPPSHSRP